ncbi:hypothetical protein D9M68_706920 [compost metagenome]
MFPRLPQRAQQVIAAHAHGQYRTRQVFAQVGGSGPCADEHVGRAAQLQFAGGLQRFGHRGVEHFDVGVGVVRRERGHQLGEAAALPGALQVAEQHDDLGNGGVHGGACSIMEHSHNERICFMFERRRAFRSRLKMLDAMIYGVCGGFWQSWPRRCSG